MPENARAPIDRRSITPSQLPLSEQAALFERLWTARQRRPPSSWQRLAVEEGFAQRTLEHFNLRALDLERNADKRPRLVKQEERDGRFFHAQLAAIPPRRALVLPSDVPEDFVPPPLRRELTPTPASPSRAGGFVHRTSAGAPAKAAALLELPRYLARVRATNSRTFLPDGEEAREQSRQSIGVRNLRSGIAWATSRRSGRSTVGSRFRRAPRASRG